MMQNQLSRLWFLNKGCKQVPLEHTRGIVTPARPELARFTYYDLDRKEWRSFRIAEFLEFKAFYRLEKM